MIANLEKNINVCPLDYSIELLESVVFAKNKSAIYRLKKSLKAYENYISGFSLEFYKTLSSLKIFVDKINLKALSADYIEELTTQHKRLDVYFVISLKPNPNINKSYKSYKIGTLFSLEKFV